MAEKKMRILQWMIALTLTCGNVAATGQEASESSPIGDWKLKAIYDKFEVSAVSAHGTEGPL